MKKMAMSTIVSIVSTIEEDHRPPSGDVFPADGLAYSREASNNLGHGVSDFQYQRGNYNAGFTEIVVPHFNDQSERQLVTIHGMVEPPDIWRGVMEKIAPGFCRGFEISMPWHCDQGYYWGLEAKPGEWLEPVFSALPAGPKVVLAHSFGANALLDVLQRQPGSDIDSLVLLSPYYKSSYEDFTWDMFRRFVSEFEAFVAASIRIRPGAERMSAASITMLIDKVKEKYGSYSWVEFYELYARTPGLKLDTLKMPTLVLGGDRDLSILPDDLHALKKGLSNARFEILRNCGHFGMVEQPEAITAVIQKFISNN